MEPLPGQECLGSHLEDARHGGFVGRSPQLREFESALRDGAKRVFLVHGGKGFGKTSLLKEFGRTARQAGHRVIELNAARNVDVEARLHDALRGVDACGQPQPASPVQVPRLAPGDAAPVLLIDDADGVETLLRTDVLLNLPARLVVVLGMTADPDAEWGIDLGWRSLVQVIPVGPLTPEDGEILLAQLGVAPEQRLPLWCEAEGHPLAMTLFAPHWASYPNTLNSPQIVESTLAHLVGPPPDEQCADALFVCAHAHELTEELLREVLGAADVARPWNWLCSLGVVQRNAHGMRMNRLVQQLVEVDFFQRYPARRIRLHAAVHRHTRDRLTSLRDIQTRCLAALRPLFAGHPRSHVSRLWMSTEIMRSWPHEAAAEERADALELFRLVGGVEDVAYARHWSRQGAASVFVAQHGPELEASVMTLILTSDEARDSVDPVVGAIQRDLERAVAARPTDTLHVLRFATDLDGGRDSASVMYLALAATVAEWLMEAPAHAVVVGPFSPRWRQILKELAMEELESTELPSGTLFHLDFRRLSPDAWLDFLIDHEMSGALGLPPRLMRPAPLGFVEFAAAVQQALRDLHHLDALAKNPLATKSGLIAGQADFGRALRDRIVGAFTSLGTGEKDRIIQRVLELAYLGSGTSQKACAKQLDLAFSTYRRYRDLGVQRVIDLLWLSEFTAEQVTVQPARPPAAWSASDWYGPDRRAAAPRPGYRAGQGGAPSGRRGAGERTNQLAAVLPSP
jgi:hypothetical protein